eukprot:6211382-Pleurochrysis_carterae.AAC.1
MSRPESITMRGGLRRRTRLDSAAGSGSDAARTPRHAAHLRSTASDACTSTTIAERRSAVCR